MLRVCRHFSSKSLKMAAKSAMVILAEGAEEMEAVITIDVLRRGGVNVIVAGLTSDGPTKCSRSVVLKPDVSLSEAAKKGPYDAIILPGGAVGAKNLSESAEVGNLLREQDKSGRIVAAICAGPIALKSHNVGHHKSITSHPSVKSTLEQDFKYSEERVVQDGNIVTSRAPGTTFEFALKLVECLQGKAKVDEITPPMLLKSNI